MLAPLAHIIPTLQDMGLKGFDVTVWQGLYAPKGTPADVLGKINAALKLALKDPDFVKKQAATMRANDKPPATLEEWTLRNAELRKNLLAAWGGFPSEACPLDPQNHGELKRDGYRVEKITFQTRPGIRMTANLYLPDKKGKLPAILQVHGHWKGAKQDPVVQSRCIGAAKLGYVVLCVDAFGAGERGVGTALGEYHGEMTAATLLLDISLPATFTPSRSSMRSILLLVNSDLLSPVPLRPTTTP